MVKNLTQNKYFNAVDSYTSLNVMSNIRGQLISKENKNIKIDIGNNQAMDIELKEDIDIKKGDTAIIERKNIVKSKVVKLDTQVKISNSESDKYSEILKKIDVEDTEENIDVAKKLDDREIDVTKENIECYKLAKGSLDVIATTLDYASVVKLIEMGVDVENESIHKLMSLINELEKEEEGSNILKIFNKKELTTDEAEDIALKLYGNKMGKDIIDIIKTLHKEKVNITRKNIEKINDVFYKLENLRDIEDKTFIDTIKNRLDINIENLYKIKRYIKDENSVAIENINSVNARAIINVEGYKIDKQSKVTEKELNLLSEDIENLMTEIELEPSKENIKLSKEFIKRDMEITKESINSVDEMKSALTVVLNDLDKETASKLTKENIDIETTDIRIIAEKIESIKKIDKSVETVKVENIESSKSEDILSKIEMLGKVREKDILTLLEKNVDFKISKIEQVIFNKIEPIVINKIQDAIYSSSQGPKSNASDKVINSTLGGIDRISTAFNKIGKLDFNTIAFQIKRNIPLTITNIQKTQSQEQLQVKYQTSENISIEQTLKNNGLEASRVNIQKSMEAYRSYNNVRFNLSSNMIKSTIANGVQIENIEINLASKYVDEYRQANNFKPTVEYQKEEFAQRFTENAYEIIKNSDPNILFLMKNRSPLSFNELRSVNSMFKNEEQLGHKISEFSEDVYRDGDDETKERFEEFKKNVLEMSQSMKGTKEELEKAYKRMEESFKDIEANIKLVNQDDNSLMKKMTKEILENMDESKAMANENKIIQFPLYMNGQFANLNMYFRDKQREGSKKDSEDISVVLSIDTVNMGNLNINLEIEKKDILIKIGLEKIENKAYLESYKNMLKETLEQGGYSIKQISFHGEDEIDFLAIDKSSQSKPSFAEGNLDIIV